MFLNVFFIPFVFFNVSNVFKFFLSGTVFTSMVCLGRPYFNSVIYTVVTYTPFTRWSQDEADVFKIYVKKLFSLYLV